MEKVREIKERQAKRDRDIERLYNKSSLLRLKRGFNLA